VARAHPATHSPLGTADELGIEGGEQPARKQPVERGPGILLFEKATRRERVHLFCRYEISPDLFLPCSLSSESGRVGVPGRVQKITSGTDAEVWERVLFEAWLKYKTGFRLTLFDGRPTIRTMLENLRVARILLDIITLNCIRPESIDDLAGISAEISNAKAEIRAKAIKSQQLEFSQVFRSNADASDAFCNNIRKAVRILSDILLQRDAHARSAVRRALTIPLRIDDSNVVHIAASRAGIFSTSLFQFFDSEKKLAALPGELLADAIRTVGQLVKLSPQQLRSKYRLSGEQLELIEQRCGDFGLWLGMTEIRFANQRSTPAVAR
jgi:hypothetical protein